MADSEPTHDNPRNTRNLPAVVHDGEVMRPTPENWLTRAIRTLFGWKPGSVRDDLQVVLDASTPDEVGFSATERTMLRNILGLHERRIADVMIHRAIAAAAEFVHAESGEADSGEAELAVMLTDDAGIRTLNSNWRGIDKPTNVLSFPALQPTGAGGPDDAPRMLGDIAIAYETTRQEADDEQKPFDHHLSHLAVHGFLHLMGYDHETDDDAEAMEGLEQEILAQLGIPNPYADRDGKD